MAQNKNAKTRNKREVITDSLTPRQQKLKEKAIARMGELVNEELARHLVERTIMFEGNIDVLEGAIGAFFMGQMFGWRVLMLIHSPKTFKRYQEVLGLDFKGKLPWNPDEDVMPQDGAFARKSNAYEVFLRLGDLWKIIKGQTGDFATSSEKKQTTLLPNE
jgi:hypothetical protein